MKTISFSLNFNQLKLAASKFGLELCEASIGFELWQGDVYKGGFTSLDDVAAQLDLRRDITAVKDAEVQEISSKIATMLSGATEAALIYNGQVIGSCKTTIKNGGCIDIANQMTAEGKPVNSIQVKISRSRMNIKKSQTTESYIPKLFNEAIFYVK